MHISGILKVRLERRYARHLKGCSVRDSAVLSASCIFRGIV
ncbi:hypothetical protein GCWU000321_01023 [Dialister invisus DSM 15470]|uniref:Uncharacterized protein n=1 Tax=Dialister invisus DSM 15470 TaxID=592028 RepID=C9LNA3_9FIRM|nr:hypothetical protein GCWU000321_01023 [Dialister invisus DSM 15470]